MPTPVRSALFNIRDITKPVDGLVVYTDSYWLCVNGDSAKALFSRDSPQANKNKTMLEWALRQKLYIEYGNLQIVFVPVAFVPNRK